MVDVQALEESEPLALNNKAPEAVLRQDQDPCRLELLLQRRRAFRGLEPPQRVNQEPHQNPLGRKLPLLLRMSFLFGSSPLLDFFVKKRITRSLALRFLLEWSPS